MQFTKAVRQNVNLLIGLAGGTGSGKSYSAMRLASGIAKAVGKRFAVVDTEAGRGLHYADMFDFDHCDLKAPFDPKSYIEAIVAADEAAYPVIVIDSMSHEWSGDGGILDMQESELDRMAGSDWQKREACKMAAWIKPKGLHKRMVSRLLQVRAHLIFCFRAEEKMEMVKVDGKTKIVKSSKATGLDGWVPVCEKNFPYEMTASFLLMAEHPGIPLKIKLQEQHHSIFVPGQPIDEECGRRIAEWAAGGTIQRPTPEPAKSQAAPTQQATPAQLLGMRWGKAYPKNQGESREAFQQRFLSWASVQSGMTINALDDLDDEAIDRCNIVLSDIENN